MIPVKATNEDHNIDFNNAQNLNLVCIVVIYGKSADSSTTLKSLVSLKSGIDKLVIHNNGPDKLANDEVLSKITKLYSVEIVETLNNRPLSSVYNNFISKNNANWYLLLDDDSAVNQELINSVWRKKGCELIVPKIISQKDKKYAYPILNQKILSSNEDIAISNDDRIFSIGSGLIISKKLKFKFLQLNLTLFDERFALYGVDFSFFRRLRSVAKKNHSIQVSIRGSLTHNLSSSNTKIERWRELERMHDEVLTRKYYSSTPTRLTIKYFWKISKEARFHLIIPAIKTYYLGRHPRSQKG